MAEDQSALLLTEDGFPIGETVLADRTNVPAPVDDAEAEENREELLRVAAQNLTGDPDADTAVAELYPGFCDPDKRKKAMELFVVGGKSADEVGSVVGVPGRTVSQWAHVFRWSDLVKNELAARESQSVLDLARIRSQKRLGIATEQLDQAKEIRNEAMKAIRSGKALKSGTEAWAAAAKIEHTLTGVSESGTVADLDGGSSKEKKDEQRKVPLVCIINGAGGLIPVRKHV